MPEYTIRLTPEVIAKCVPCDGLKTPLAVALREQHGIDVFVKDHSTGADCVYLIAHNDPEATFAVNSDGNTEHISGGMPYDISSEEAAHYEELWRRDEHGMLPHPNPNYPVNYEVELPYELVALAKGGQKLRDAVKEFQSDFREELKRLRDAAAGASMDQHWGDKGLLRAIVALHSPAEADIEDEGELAVAATTAIRDILFETC